MPDILERELRKTLPFLDGSLPIEIPLKEVDSLC